MHWKIARGSSQMSSSYLLDSRVLVLSLKKVKLVLERLARTITFYTSVVALGELYYGAEHSTNFEKNLAEVNELANSMSVLITDSETARINGRLKHEQRTVGLMLPDNDLWIAATAVQFDLTLAARDHHFTWIARLTLEQW